MIERDSVLVVALRVGETAATTIGPLLVADCQLAVARALASTVRAQDVVHEAPEGDGFIALLRGGTSSRGRPPGGAS